MGERMARAADVESVRKRGQSTFDQVSAMGTTMALRTIRVGAAAAPLLVLGGSADLVIQWATPLPTAEYSVDLSGLTGILGRAALAVVAQDAASVTVRVTATLAITAGSLILAVAMC